MVYECEAKRMTREREAVRSALVVFACSMIYVNASYTESFLHLLRISCTQSKSFLNFVKRSNLLHIRIPMRTKV